MCIRNHHLPKGRDAGLTLVELVMFIVVVSIALLGIVKMLDYTTSKSVDPQRRKQALSIAEGLLEEVELAHFTFCDPTDATADSATSTAGCTTTVENVGPEAGNARPFDNVNDYVTAFGAAQSSFNSGATLVDANGAAFPVTGYTATLTIAPDANLGPAGGTIASAAAPASMEVLRITVTVSYGNNESVTLEGYRTRYNPRGPNSSS
jgi:MSHA pilin protein MshD